MRGGCEGCVGRFWDSKKHSQFGCKWFVCNSGVAWLGVGLGGEDGNSKKRIHLGVGTGVLCSGTMLRAWVWPGLTGGETLPCLEFSMAPGGDQGFNLLSYSKQGKYRSKKLVNGLWTRGSGWRGVIRGARNGPSRFGWPDFSQIPLIPAERRKGKTGGQRL